MEAGGRRNCLRLALHSEGKEEPRETHPSADNRSVQLHRRVVQTAKAAVLLTLNRRLEVV